MLMMKLHMLDGMRKTGTYNTPEHRQKALEVARESVVLLKNEEQILPFAKDKVKKLLVVGENADRVHSNGGGSAEIKALYEITPLMGIKTFLGGNVEVTYVPGYISDVKQEVSDTNWQETSLENGGGSSKVQTVDLKTQEKRAALRKEAVQLAAQYEHVLFVGGLNHDHDSEGNDRIDMRLPYEQDELIQGLLAANPNTVVTFVGGSPVEMGRWMERAKSVVWSWYAGMEGGNALAEVLFGEVNPSGKLPETFYKKHTDCSAHVVGEFPGDTKVRYTEGIFVGYRYNDTYEIEPEFCFGHGLSYTTFSYTNPKVTKRDGKSYVECEVTNTGKRAGKEVVQVYTASVQRKETEPIQELKGFEKIELLPGEKNSFCSCGSRNRKKELRIGSSSRDIRLVIESR